jgi:hypothetical protein
VSRALYGRVAGDDKSGVTQAGTREITCWVQTTKGRVTVELRADGVYRIWGNPVWSHVASGCDSELAAGNVNDLAA